MFDPTELDAMRLIRLLLAMDRSAPASARDDSALVNGNIDDAEDARRDDDVWIVAFTCSEVSSSDDAVFPGAKTISAVDVAPNENDMYRSDVVALLTDVFAQHDVIVAGDHSGSGVSDRGYSAYFIGTATVVRKQDAKRHLAEAVQAHRASVADDLLRRMEELVAKLSTCGREELKGQRFMDGVARLNRLFA